MLPIIRRTFSMSNIFMVPTSPCGCNLFMLIMYSWGNHAALWKWERIWNWKCIKIYCKNAVPLLLHFSPITNSCRSMRWASISIWGAEVLERSWYELQLCAAIHIICEDEEPRSQRWSSCWLKVLSLFSPWNVCTVLDRTRYWVSSRPVWKLRSIFTKPPLLDTSSYYQHVQEPLQA